MKKKFSLMLTVLFILSTLLGCQSTSGDASEKDSIVDKAIENGKLAVVDKEYKKAVSNFELALSEDKENKEAKEWLGLSEKMESLSVHLQNKEVDKAEKEIDAIKSDDLYDAVKSQIEEYEKTLTDLKSSIEDIASQIASLNDKLEEGAYDEVIESGNALKNNENVTEDQLAEIDNIIESATTKQSEAATAKQSEETTTTEEGSSQDETSNEQESEPTLSLDQMRSLAKQYVDNWNGYDNQLLDEYDYEGVRVYEFKDGPTEHIIGVTVNYKTGEVTPDMGMF